MAGVPIVRRQSRFIRGTSSLGEQFWRAAAKYHLLGKEGGGARCYIYLADKGRYNMVRAETSQHERSKRNCSNQDTEGCMDCPHANIQAVHWTPGPLVSSSNEADDRRGSEAERSEDKCCSSGDPHHEKTCVAAVLKGFSPQETQIFKFLTNNLISPPESCTKTWKWIQSGIRVKEQDESFKHVISTYKRWLRLLTFEELVDFYQNKFKIYAAIDVDFYTVYWSIEESLNKLEFYLEQQLGTPELAFEFMEVLYKQQTRQGGKKGNSIWIKGESDSAKSWFIDSLKCLQISYGGCSILNRTNNFAMAGLVDVRLAILDEFNFDPVMYTDTVKLLLSGNNLQACIKYKNDGIVMRTPVILLSNGECLPNNDIFNSRHTRYEWRRIDISSYIPLSGKEPNIVHEFFSRNLHPECFIDYWKKYKIWGVKYQTNMYSFENDE